MNYLYNNERIKEKKSSLIIILLFTKETNIKLGILQDITHQCLCFFSCQVMNGAHRPVNNNNKKGHESIYVCLF